ncbi:MAG: Hsp20/alpha crystallin family protein [Altibacter sp.]|uniref:Hsp20/alpha crystallin family protein n=1 Tax=Altibacter sp. TaxID=2024823 RepID=UPI001D61909E|nr:Hsp20/alpha crystallin family protein [Altibacter sp.]MBZ0326008.1 Hsp20/alpha crystallin family protein [Altibacter sp.]
MKLVKRNNVWFPTIFDDIFNENRLDVPNYENFSIPAVNIKENLANFALELAVPGLKKEDFTIEVDENVLKISAEVKNEKEDAKKVDEHTKVTRKEFNYSSFKRSFTLPETVEVDSINATYNNGLLLITIPKKEEQKEIKRMVEIS